MKKQLQTTNAQSSSAFFSAAFYSNESESLMKRLFQPLLRNLFVFILITGFAESVKADFAVTTNSGSGLSATYPSLAAAITALNAATITSPVIITCPTGSETSPAGGYSITATGTAVNTIIINGNGAANSIITAPTPAGVAGALNDAIFKIIGGDFITISGFAMNENPANDGSPVAEFTAATNTMVEWGIALLYATSTNGAQNCTIQNNSITLNRLYQNSFGIYSNSTHTATTVTTSASATTTAGGNSGLKIYGNTITNVNQGICVVGPTAAADMNTGLDIGGAGGAQANMITNWGTTGTFSAYANVSGTLNCILVRNSFGFNVSFNTLTSSVGGNTVTASERAIYVPSFSVAPIGTFTNTINNNNISVQSGIASGSLNGIIVETTTGTVTSSLTMNSNNFNTFGHTVASPTGACTFINSTMANLNTTINSNTFTAITLNSTGSVTFISNSITIPAGGSQTINNNSIVTSFNRTGASGSIAGITTAGGSTTITSTWSNNNFSNITIVGTSSLTVFNQTDGGSVNHNIIGNTINNIVGGTGSIIGIVSNFGGQNGSTGNLVSGNTISGITSSGAITGINIGSAGSPNLSTVTGNSVTGLTTTGASAVIGITSAAPTNCNIHKNTICNLEANNASGIVSGIVVSAGSLHTLSNNRIGDLRTPAANAANFLIGISITGGTTTNVYYNTVYLTAMSSGALFGSSAISVATSSTVTLDNNIFVNTSSVMGAGLAVAYRRSSTTLTTYGSGSDRNDFFATTIFTDGTGPNTFSALGPYKTFVGPTRDANSVTENPPFLSTTCGNTNFLKINTAIPTLVESNGANVGGITDDFENDIRFGNPGYMGTGTKPDIGADEFDGMPLPVCNSAPTPGSITGAAAVCTGTGTTLTLTGATNALGITYQWRSGTTMGGPYPTLLGTSITQATGPLTMPTYYVVDVTCTNPGGSTVTTSEKSILINPLPSVMVSPTSGSICNPGGTAVTLTASGATTYTWSPTAGLTPTTGAVVAANPNSTTTYTVTGSDMNGCMNTAQATISVAPKVYLNTITATPSTVCSGSTSSLNVIAGTSAAYTMSAAPFGLITATGPVTNTAIGDDALLNTLTLPFNFSFFGNTYSSILIYSNGYVAFQTGVTSTPYNQTIPSSVAPDNFIAISHDDLNVTASGQMSYFTNGTTPNQIFVINYNGVKYYNTNANNGNLSGQIQIFEADGHIEIHVQNSVDPVPSAKTLGIENVGGTLGYSPATRNNVTYDITTPEAWKFIPTGGSLSYSWTPATGLTPSAIVQNPTTPPLASTTIYTVTVSDASGCSASGSVTVTVDPLTCTPTTSTAACANSNFTVTANHTGGGAPYGYVWSDGIGGVYPNAKIITANLPAGMYTFTTTVTDNCGSMCTSSVVITVNALPTIMVSPPSGAICNPGGSPIALTASGGTTYTWSPTSGLTPTTGAMVNANPTNTTTYTVTGTDGNGCMNTASATVNVGNTPQIVATATPASICLGSNSQLLASVNSDYTVSSTTYALQSTAGFVNGPLGDDVISGSIPLPFAFSFYGTLYNSIFINTNGQVGFDYTGSTAAQQRTAQTVPNAPLPNANISLCWVDLNPIAGQIKYGTTGMMPNRIFVIDFNAVPFFSGGGTVSGQIQLYEGTNKIQVHLTSVTTNTGLKTLGIENAAGVFGTAPSGRNNVNFLVGSPEAWEFNQVLSYLWSPTTFIPSGQETTYNPLATSVTTPITYTVTVTSGFCSNTASTSIAITPPPAVSGPPTICSGQTAQYSPMSGGMWMSSNPMVATISNTGLASGITTGMITFTFTSTATGCSNTINATVIPTPSTTITSNTSIYQGSSGNIASVPDAGMGASYVWSLSSGMITSGAGTNSIIYNAGTPPSMNINVTVTSSNGCSSSGNKVVTVVVPGSPTMTWEPDNVTPTPLCGPATNCCKDTLCFNLKYTPGVTGFLTTYTTGFFINCLGGTPVGYNESCVMTDNSFQIGNCAAPMDSVLFNSSGQNGGLTVPITQGSPKILHRLCLNIATGESAQIREDIITNLTTSVDQVGSGHITEFPAYTPQTFSKPGFIVPANVTVTINCPADTIFPVPPPRFDFCGNPVQDSLISRVSIPSSLTCEGTKTYTFRYKDCSGYTQLWSFTYVIEYLDFSISAGPGGSIVSCPALSDIVPIPPVVVDHCGRTITPTYTDTGRPACEGFRFYVFTYTDCEGNTHNWVYAYNVEYEPIPNPVDVVQTVNCPLLANVVPVPPVVVDNCGVTLSPSGPTSTPALTAMTCEGTRSFTWTYVDCESNTQDFVYTYIVERQPFADPVDAGITVGCPVQTNVVPVPPMVLDNCGTSLSPSGPVVSPIPTCEGTRTYTWTYTDCEGNTGDYVFTYTVDRPPFTVPANQGSIVNCPEASNVVPVAPTVVDACGVTLIPIDTMSTAPVTCQGVDVTRTYTFHFMDCSGLTLPWVYTYTVRCFPLTLKVFLEGPYDAMGDTMKATLNTNHVLPGQDKLLSPSMSVQLQAPFTPFGQPYNMPPWNYNGNTGLQYGDPSAPGAPMGVIPYPADVVDWVLVTVRKNGILPANNFWTCAGWVHTNGVVTFPDPCPGLVFNPGDSCYVLVQHRTHLGVLSTHAATSACTNYIINWDFTTTNSYAPIFRYGQKVVEPGKWAMHAANGDQITSIAAIGSADLTTWRTFQNAYGYSIGDYNMSAFTESAGDESLWKANQNRTSGIIFY